MRERETYLYRTFTMFCDLLQRKNKTVKKKKKERKRCRVNQRGTGGIGFSIPCRFVLYICVCVCVCACQVTQLVKANTIARDCFSCVTGVPRLSNQIISRSWDLSQGEKSNCWRDTREEIAPSEFPGVMRREVDAPQGRRISSAHGRDSKSALIAWDQPPTAAAASV